MEQLKLNFGGNRMETKRSQFMYPEPLRNRVHELFYLRKIPMRQVVVTIKNEFPDMAHKIRDTNMYSVAHSVQRQLGKRQKGGIDVTLNRIATPEEARREFENKRGIIIGAAKILRGKGFRWAYVVGRLKSRFPRCYIPAPQAFCKMVEATVKPERQAMITIDAQDGNMLSMKVSKQMIGKVIKTILGY
jgi:hypothetical protein